MPVLWPCSQGGDSDRKRNQVVFIVLQRNSEASFLSVHPAIVMSQFFFFFAKES